jgi:hypothetical protein
VPKAPKLDFAQHDAMMWLAIGAAGLVAVYLVIKVVIPQLTKAAGSAAQGVADSVANAPAGIINAVNQGGDNLWAAITRSTADKTGQTPAAIAAANAGANMDMGGTNFGAVDGATW